MKKGYMDAKRKRPLAYIKVYNSLCEMVEQMEPNEKLPTEEELIAQFGVSRNTVRQALQLMQEDRLIHKRQGSGAYVSKKAFLDSVTINRYSAPHDFLDIHGIDAVLADLRITMQDVDELESGILDLQKGSPIYVISRNYCGVDKPHTVYAYLLDFVPPKVMKNIPEGLTTSEMVSFIDGLGRSATSIISAPIAGTLHTNMLKVPANTPLLLLQQVIRDRNGDILYFNKTYFNSLVTGLTVQVDRD